MVDEQLEFAISQFADGTLPAGQRDALAARISGDPALTALLAEYRSLVNAVDACATLPAINWDRLAGHLSGAVAQSDVDSGSMRIYAMPWVRRVAGLAVAACLAIVIGVSFEHHAGSKPAAVVGPAELAVAGPVAEVPAGAVVQEITVGPSPAVAMDDSTWRYGDSGVVSQPQRVVIAASEAVPQENVGQDTSATPY